MRRIGIPLQQFNSLSPISLMFDPHSIRRNFSRAAKTYDEHAQLQQVVREECIAMAEGLWQKDSHILDLGCGTGVFAKETRQRRLDWQTTQMDIAEGMCRQAYIHNPATVAASADAIPFASQSFDGIFSSLVLQWIYDPLPVMREIARVLKPSGTCVISTLARGTLQELRESFATVDDAPHVNRFADPAPLTALTVHGGFSLMACEEEIITIHYPDVATLMRSLKFIGASGLQDTRKGGLMTPRKLRTLEDTYRGKFGKKKGQKNTLPATWHVLYMVLQKT